MYRLFKRLFDCLFSLIVLLLLLPLMAAIALVIKLTSEGPVFYCSPRVGKNYKIAHLYKFRTMYVDADERLMDMLNRDPSLKKEWETYFKLKNDPRTTALGKFLRKTSLDELPQFFNVLKGELSVVGPRPFVFEEGRDLRPQMEALFGKRCDAILSVKPGITGLWQTSGRSNLSLEKRRHLELCYVKRRSFLLDLKLVAKTIPVILFSKGAY